MKFEFVQAQKAEFPIRVLCENVGITPAGYYAWLKRKPSNRTLENADLSREIASVFKSRRCAYGSPRIHRELRARGQRVGRKRVEHLMRQQGLRARRKRAFRHTTDSHHTFPLAPNLLKRNFKGTRPNAVWVADTTFIATGEGWLYLAVVLDLFSRRVVGWSVSHANDTALVLAALQRAIARRKPAAGLLHHSDRGSTYASVSYRAALKVAGIKASMSRRGDCWDNAVAESFFSTLRFELTTTQPFATRREAMTSLGDYIDNFYNLVRRHSTNCYLSPIEYELRNAARAA